MVVYDVDEDRFRELVPADLTWLFPAEPPSRHRGVTAALALVVRWQQHRPGTRRSEHA